MRALPSLRQSLPKEAWPRCRYDALQNATYEQPTHFRAVTDSRIQVDVIPPYRRLEGTSPMKLLVWFTAIPYM
jgi:hypothetical protein